MIWPFGTKGISEDVCRSIAASNEQGQRIKELKRGTAQTARRARVLHDTNHFGESLETAFAPAPRRHHP